MPHRTSPHRTPIVPPSARPESPGYVDDAPTLDGAEVPHGHLPRDAETPDTQEALYAPDGVWELAEVEGEGSRTATAAELQIEADGLSIIEEDDLRSSGDDGATRTRRAR